MSGTVLAVVVAVFGLVLSALWFGVSRRRKAETVIGVQSLANMKWRDCVAVVLEALHRDGYLRGEEAEAGGSGGTQFLLSRGDDKVLLGYKHGTAYHLTEANVREFVNTISLNGARRGILLTLGTVEPRATNVASSHDILLMDGSALWLKVRQFIQPNLLDSVRRQAAAQTRKGLWTGAFASVLTGAAVYFIGQSPVAPTREETVASDEVSPVRAEPAARRSDAAMLAQINATAQAMAEVAKLSNVQLAQRRASAAKQVSLLPQVDLAAWSAQRTLLITLNKGARTDTRMLDEVCRILLQNEEMRFTRVQLELPSESGPTVRWRLCD